MTFIKNFLKNKKIVRISGLVLLFLILLLSFSVLNSSYSLSLETIAMKTAESKNYIYLSDLDYLTDSGMSQNGWDGHEIQKDKNQEGGTLSLIVDGEKRTYMKGVSIHGRGWATYDISSLSADYPRFTAKLGVDASRGTNGSLFFRIYASYDGTTWDMLLQTPILSGISEAVDVDLDIEGYKYLRVYVDPNGSNAADHGTVADARLVTRDYVASETFYDRIHKVEYYDEILREYDAVYNYEHNYNLILERDTVNKLGFWNIQGMAEFTDGALDTLDWIFDNNRVLEEVVEVGELSSGSVFLTVLSELYNKYEDDLSTENGYVYEKMMIGLAAAYSTDKIISPLAFSFQNPNYDYMERFEIMKSFFDNNQLRRVNTNVLAGTFVQNEWFKDYHVELMRMVMQDGTSNTDLVWLNGFTNEKQSVSFYMINYVSPTYTLDKYYAEENREKYDQQFYLSKYNVPYGLVNGVKVARYWMVFANGGICWNASRVGQSMYRVNGIPATGAYQPGHELYIQYYEDANGNGYWTPRYGNWGWAGNTWGGGNPYRYIFNWNNKSFADRHISGSKGASSTGYLYLGQANLNRLEQYQESLYYNLIANSYTSNEQKLASYFKALEVNDLNLDSYDGIITLYKSMSVQNEGGTITSHDWYELANKIIDAYTYYPVAMFDLLKVIRPYLEGSERLHIDRLEKEALQKAAVATANETLQVDGVKTHANQLLNQTQPDPITFSFDGDNGGKIVKNPIYQFAWGYSLDGGNTWAKFNNNGTETEFTDADDVTLTPDEIASITAENDIILKFMGLQDYRFTIDITTGTLSTLLYPNDLENRVVGVDLTYEWRNSESDPWTSYSVASPDNTGNKTLYVRRGATGTQLASDSATYTFTADNQPNERKYVPVSHLSIQAVSTEATSNGGAAIYAIDGNYNTRWHSAWNGTDTERYIVIKLDKLRYVSAVEFVPAGGGNGRINDGTVWGSVDGENWEILSQKTGITYSAQANTNEQAVQFTQNFEIANPKEVQYIKIVADRTNGNWFAARAFNIFQDLTQNPRPTAGVGYSTSDPTQDNVVARLVNVSSDNYEILSEGGDTHTFTENGEFTFRFRDLDTGFEGTALAKVDWIDRTSPTATIEYSTTLPINGSVIATLKPSEEVTVTNNSKGGFTMDGEGNIYNIDGVLVPGYKADSDGNVRDADGNYVMNINTYLYEFLSNGEFTFEFEDKAGNKGSVTAKVDWINHDIPNATLTYDKNTLTNQNVTVTISFDKDAVVTNNGGSKTYTFTNNGEFTFEFSDLAGNAGVITAKVNWIDKEVPTAELKYERVGDKVVVKVVNPSKEITFQEGIGVYEFTRNGTYEIVFYDKAGNVGKLTAVIKEFDDEGDINQPVTPDNPTTPSNPSNPGTTNPGNSGTNKPGNSGNTGGNNNPSTNPGGNNSGNSTGGNTVIDPINKEYEKYNIRNIVVEIPKNELKEGYTVNAPSFNIPSSMDVKFGEDSEYYDIYVLDENGERIDIATESPIKITISLKKTKRFLGVYEITEDNKVRLVEYERNGDNIEILGNKLGKYVVSYKELEVVNPEITIPVVKEKENDIIMPVILGLVSAVIVGTTVYASKKKKEK